MPRRDDTAPDASPDPRYLRFKDELHRTVVDVVDLSRLETWGEDRLRSEIDTLARKLAPEVDRSLSAGQIRAAADDVTDEVFGLGPLEPLLQDPAVTEILVNGAESVFVERSGRLSQVPVRFADNAHVFRVVQRIAARVGRRVDESSPMVDARLPDGSRVNAVLPPLTLDGPVLSIRRFGQVLSADDLLNGAAFTREMGYFLKQAVAARVNILISGGTGAGKTTLLNVLSGYIGADERLVTIEDVAELRLQRPHVVRMEARSANLEGQGQVGQRELVRNALRMRPDRIILGECRGPEVVDMLQAMNTGHEGSLTTVHANDARDALARLELMVGLGGVDIPIGVLRGYIAGAIGLVVHVSRLVGGGRRVTRIAELVGLSSKTGGYKLRDVFAFHQTGVSDGHAVGVFAATGYVPKVLRKLTAAGRTVPADVFHARDLLEVGPADDADDGAVLAEPVGDDE